MVIVVSQGSQVSFEKIPDLKIFNGGFVSNQERADFLEKVGRAGRYIQIYFDKHQEEISASHNFGHVSRVASYAALVSEALGADERTSELARAAGYLHDRVRFPGEKKPHGPPSAEKSELLMLYPILEFKEKDQQIILNAIEKHEANPSWWTMQDRRDEIPKNPMDIVQTAVRVADAALEANGPYVLARRAAFVSGERLNEGDLKETGLTPYQAFACESFIRLRLKNPRKALPKYLRPLVDDLFTAQYGLYYPLLNNLGLDEMQIARLAQEKGLGGSEKAVEAASGLSTGNLIRASSVEVGNSATEVIDYFSKSGVYNQDLTISISAWEPQCTKAKEWKLQMLTYLNGELDVKGKIQEGLKK